MENKLATTMVNLKNGTDSFNNLVFTVLPHIEFDMIIGRNFRQQLGYKLIGVPSKKPGPELLLLEEAYRTRTTLARNAKGTLLEPCSHPLAVWNLAFTDEPTYWAR
jgi:hypothetical protein